MKNLLKMIFLSAVLFLSGFANAVQTKYNPEDTNLKIQTDGSGFNYTCSDCLKNAVESGRFQVTSPGFYFDPKTGETHQGVVIENGTK